MRRRLLWIGGALAALAVLVAGGGYVAYKSDLFRSAETERGETLPTNEAEQPEPAPKPKRKPAKASWPFFRYDALRNGVNPGAHARPPFNVAWSKKVPRRGYLEAPAVVGGGKIVYASYGTRNGSDIFVRNARTGRLVWKKHYRHGSNFAGSAGIFKGRVYITSHDGNIRCYLLRNGKIRFRKKIASAESPPIGRGRYVYFGDGPKGGDGKFYAIDWRTGRTIWSFKAKGNISSGAALTRSTLYFSAYGGGVYALNRFNGKLRWKTTVRGARNNLVPFYSTPALGGGRLVVGGTDGSVYALDARDGAQKWRYDGDGYVYGSAAIWHKRVLLGDFGGGFYALSLKSGRQLWKHSLGPIIGSATVMRGLVYISTLRPARTFAFDARTGRQVWAFGDGQFSPIIADGRQVWLTGKAHVYRLGERLSKREKAAARRAAVKRKARRTAARRRAAARKGE
jgi:outer membrane protein assembly factor BamB